MSYEAVVNFKRFQIKIPFETVDDLQSKLSGLDFTRLEKAIVGAVGEPSEVMSQVKPGLEDIYTLDTSGSPLLLKVPKSEPKAVALALFAAEPRRLLPEEITRITGVEQVGRKYLSTNPYKPMFVKDDDGRYGLSLEGKKTVLNEIIPALKSVENSDRYDKKSSTN